MAPRNWVISRGAVAAILVAYLGIAVAFLASWNNQRQTSKTISANRRALVYICSTTTVLDALVKAAGDQTAQNFEDGTYDKLLSRGIITQRAVDAARKSLVEYRASQKKLEHNGACNRLVVAVKPRKAKEKR